MNTGATDIPDITEAPINTDVPHFTSVPFENTVLTPEDVATLNEYTNLGSSFQNLLETEDGIYIVKEGLLYYSDKEYHEWMPLCGKPECNHTYTNSNCNAYVGGDTDPDVEYYDGYIYYADAISTNAFDPIKLYRMKPDGSDHELFKELEPPAGEYTGKEYTQSWHSVTFCGRYYLYRYTVEVTEDSAIDPQGIYAMDLADIDKEPVKLDDSLGQEGKSFLPWYLAQKGEMLYSMVSGEDHAKYIMEQNLSTGAGRILAEIDHYISVGSSRHFIIHEDEALLRISDQESSDKWIYRIDRDTGSLIEVAHDGEFMHIWSELDPKAGFIYGCAQPGSRFGETWLFSASDLNGNELWRVGEEVLPEGTATLRISFITEDYIFFHDKNDGNYMNILPKWYVEKSAIAMGHFEIKAWEP